MPALMANRECSITDATRYKRHRPERMLLYQVAERHYPAFLAGLEGQGHALPNHVQREFADFLKWG